MTKQKNKFLIGLFLTIFLVGISYSYFYFDQLSETYVSDNLQEINIDLQIEGTDNPYLVTNTFKSRDNYNITPTINGKQVNLGISGVNKQGFIGFELTGDSGEVNSYIIYVKPNQTFTDTDILNYKVTPVISGFSEGRFNIDLNDPEINDNTIKNTGLNFNTSLFSYDGEYYFSIQGGKIEKFSKNFHHLNTFDIDLGVTGLFVNNITDIKSTKDSIYLRFNDGKILHGTRVGDTFNFLDTGNTYSDIGINNNNIVSPLFLSSFTGVKDYERIGNFLYVLTDSRFEVYYIIGGMNNISLIYSEDNNDNLESFIVDRGVYLFDNLGNLSIINNDFQIYYLKDENNINQGISTTNNFDNYKPTLSIDGSTLIPSVSLLSSSAEDLINGFKYTTDGGIPVYNQKSLGVNISGSDFTKLSITRNLFIDKFSSNYGMIEGDGYSVDINIPLIGYGVSFSYKGLADNISPKLNVGINDILLKQFNINEGELYLHIRAFDYGMNKSIEIIKGPIIVKNNNPKIGNPYINTNLVNLDGGDDVRFMFKSSKQLSEVLVTIEDDYKNLSTFTLGDLDYTENYDGFTYIINYSIAGGVNQLKFNIEGKDLGGNKTSTYYEYNLNSGWFQVLGVSQTNAGIGGNLSKNQKEKGFIYGVASKSNVSSEINTDYKFNVNNNDFNYLPVNDDGTGLITVNHSLLKNNFKVFNGKARKNIDDTFFYELGDKTKPIKNLKFLNGYYYYYDGDLMLDEVIFSGNGVLLVNGDLDITGDLIKDLNSETEKYPNELKIYTTGNINVFSNTKKVDSYLFTNERLTTLSIAYDLENGGDLNSDNIFKNTDGKIYYDFNGDSKVDLITYEDISNNKKIYNLYVMGDNNKYTNNKLTSSGGLLGESIDYNTSSTNIIDGVTVKDIIISNGGVDTTYFINPTLNGLIEQ